MAGWLNTLEKIAKIGAQAAKVVTDYAQYELDNLELAKKSTAMYDMGRYRDALRYAEAAIEHKPTSFWGWLYRGNALARLQCYEDAMMSYKKAFDINQESDLPLYNMACVCATIGYEEGALKGLEEAISINSENRRNAASDPDFKSLYNHPRFIALTRPFLEYTDPPSFLRGAE